MTNSPEHSGASPAPTAKAPAKTTGKRGYWWSGALALTAALLFGLADLLHSNPIKVTPDITEEFTSDDVLAFEVAEGEDEAWAIYSTGTETAGCAHYPPSHQLQFTGIHQLHKEGYGEWYLQGTLDTSEPGRHTVSCTDTADLYVLASASPFHAVQHQLRGVAFTVYSVIPALLLAAVVVGVVTALRRRSARKLTPVAQAHAPHAAPPQQHSSPQSPHQR